MNARLLETVLRDAAARAAAETNGASSDADLISRVRDDRDDAAFAALVARHGRVVWAVCRQSLPREADAEDAFQATFVALFRGIGSIRSGETLPGWLHGTAVRVCLQSRKQSGRLKKRESKAKVSEVDRPVAEASWDGLLASVHEEVAKLPAKLRDPFVLVDLQGVSQAEAADRLGWKAGTFTGRLSQARQALLDRLSAKGLTPAIVLAGAGLGPVAATAVVPSSVYLAACSVVQASNIPASVSLLAAAALEGPFMAKMKLFAAGAILSVAAATTIVAAQQGSGPGMGSGGALPAAGAGVGQIGRTIENPSAGGGAQNGNDVRGRGGRGGGAAGGQVGTPGMGMPGGGGQGIGAPGGMGGFGTNPLGGWQGARGFEYKVARVGGNEEDCQRTLNQHGQDGWELVSVMMVSSARGDNSIQCIGFFKRAKLNPPPGAMGTLGAMGGGLGNMLGGGDGMPGGLGGRGGLAGGGGLSVGGGMMPGGSVPASGMPDASRGGTGSGAGNADMGGGFPGMGGGISRIAPQKRIIQTVKLKYLLVNPTSETINKLYGSQDVIAIASPDGISLTLSLPVTKDNQLLEEVLKYVQENEISAAEAKTERTKREVKP